MNNITDSTQGEAAKKPRSYLLYLLAIFLVAFFIRLIGITRYECDPDECRMVESALLFWEGYPPFFWEGYGFPTIVLWAIAYAAVWGIIHFAEILTLLAAKNFQGLILLADAGYRHAYADPGFYNLLPISLNALTGSALTLVCYGISKRQFNSALAGLISAATVAFAPRMVYWSSTLHPEMMMGLGFMGAIYFAMRHVDGGGNGSLVGAAIMVALMTACKIVGVVLVPMIVLAVAMAPRVGVVVRLKRLALALAVMAGAYLAFNPYSVMDITLFAKGIYSRWTYFMDGEYLGREYHPTGLIYLLTPLRAMGYPPLVMGVVGLFVALFTNTRKALLLVAGVGAYILLMKESELISNRYAIQVGLAVAVLTGGPAVATAAALKNRGKRRAAILTGLVLALAAVPFWNTPNAIGKKLTGDTRAAAREWILNHVPSGSRVFETFVGPILPYNMAGIERGYRVFGDRIYKERDKVFKCEFFADAMLSEERYLFKKFAYMRENVPPNPAYDVVEIIYFPDDPKLFEDVDHFWAVTDAAYLKIGVGPGLYGRLKEVLRYAGVERARFSGQNMMGPDVVIYEVQLPGH